MSAKCTRCGRLDDPDGCTCESCEDYNCSKCSPSQMGWDESGNLFLCNDCLPNAAEIRNFVDK